jgi:hypothetical protein
LQREVDKNQTTNNTNHTNEEKKEIQAESDSPDLIRAIPVIRGSASGGLSIPVPPKYTSADFLKTA